MISKRKIEFRGKTMNPLESKLYILGLKAGIINVKLNEEEREDYVKWEEERNLDNELSNKLIGKSITKMPNERRYVMYLFRKKSVYDTLSKDKKDKSNYKS